MRFWFLGPRIGPIRSGISIGPEDFRSTGRSHSTASGADADKFIYVIRGNGLVKIGISADPAQRLAQLQNGFDTPLELTWLAAPDGDAAAIEREAHDLLRKYRRNGEWFDTSPDIAVGAVSAAAYRRGQQLLTVSPERAKEIRQIGARLATTNKPMSTALGRVAVAVLQLLLGFVLAIAFLAFFAIRFGRML